jgi:putative PIN family toxin of toxin-antitoxin system
MKRIVLDSTVLVSAFLIEGGVSAKILQTIRLNGHAIAVCDAILEEMARVLLTYSSIRKRYSYSDEAVHRYLSGIEAVAQHVLPLPVRISRDPNDDVIIGCAQAGNADAIITRDNDLLVLKTVENISIMTPEKGISFLRLPSQFP